MFTTLYDEEQIMKAYEADLKRQLQQQIRQDFENQLTNYESEIAALRAQNAQLRAAAR